jgi:hypothetical protein
MPSVGATRFYRPVLARPTGKERVFAGERLGAGYRRGTTLDVADFDFFVPGSPQRLMTRRVALRGNNKPEDFAPEFFDMGPFQITYNFSRAVRDNTFPLKNAFGFRKKVKGEYGAKGWSYRMLYEFLCEAYNNGYPFVDTYFGQVFKTRTVYSELRRIYNSVKVAIALESARLFEALPLKKDGTPDMRFNVSKRYKDFKVWQNPIIRQECKRLAQDIRDDIAACLSTGLIPLSKRAISEKTKAAREKLIGLDPTRVFFASGRLIRHLNIYVEIGKAA